MSFYSTSTYLDKIKPRQPSFKYKPNHFVNQVKSVHEPSQIQKQRSNKMIKLLEIVPKNIISINHYFIPYFDSLICKFEICVYRDIYVEGKRYSAKMNKYKNISRRNNTPKWLDQLIPPYLC